MPSLPFLPRFLRRRATIAVIELHGILSAKEGALNIRAVGPAIDRAFRAARRGGHVVLDIDSPGGSPVHSQLIADRIRRRAAEHATPVTAVVQEVGASGGYWLACAADDIRAGSMSIVGSIGVVGGGFGFPGLLNRLGVERRLYTSGTNKARLDPFSPEKPEDVEFTKALMEDIHDQFKAWVSARRGTRLKMAEADLFDGRVLLGGPALAAGLIDSLGELDTVLKELKGKTRRRAKTFRPVRKRGLLSRLPRMAAAGMAEAVMDSLDQRLAQEAGLPALRL